MDDGSAPAEPPSLGGGRPGLEVDVIGGEGHEGGSGWLSRTLRAVLLPLGVGGQVRVRVVGDSEIAAAHERWAGVAGTTDVLTFDLREGDPPSGPLDVDILVCLDEAGRQALARGHEMRHELLLYALHGVLHCLGYDDHDDDQARAMHATEDRLLAGVGLGPVYAGAASHGGGS